MEHVRCARCRNPIRGRQAAVEHPRAGLTFHLDCWTSQHEQAQQDYLRHSELGGLQALLAPYTHDESTEWLLLGQDDPGADDTASGDPGQLAR